MTVDEKLIKAITVELESFGMPEFSDNLPAMSILQLVKDAGYSHANKRGYNMRKLNGGASRVSVEKIYGLLIKSKSNFRNPNHYTLGEQGEITMADAKMIQKHIMGGE